MQLASLRDLKLTITIENDYSSDYGIETLLVLSREYSNVDEYIDISNPLELGLLKENLEEILKHVTEAYNYVKGFSI